MRWENQQQEGNITLGLHQKLMIRFADLFGDGLTDDIHLADSSQV
jgi:hypothetical protein